MGFDTEPDFLPPATSSLHILRLLGVVSIDGSVAPPSTDAWHGPSIRLYSPPAIHQLSAGVFVFVVVVVAAAFWSLDLSVIQTSSKV
jgi:hypothetical protein